MKDITRIHIAKVPYEIEHIAKKDLEVYIAKLEAYAQDADVLEDIEIRITELLHQRGVKQNNVISSNDVKAVCEQLGDPKEFMTDTDVVIDDVEVAETRKQLYRNADTALVGGVMSGVACYFGINLILTRLIFIFLTFISAGFALFVYVVLWFIVPVAKTAAQKLSMSGRPVTLASIRKLNEEIIAPNNAPQVFRRIATVLIGTGGLLSALAVIVGAIYALVGLNQVADGRNLSEVIVNSIGSNYVLSFSLGAIAAVTFVLFSLLVAYAAFKQIFTRKIWITGLALIALGMTVFGASVASIAYGRYDLSVEAQKRIVTKQIVIPAGFDKINELSVGAAEDFQFDAEVEYVVSASARIELVTSRNDEVNLVVEGEHAKLQYVSDKSPRKDYFNNSQTRIRMYGPTLKSFDTEAMKVYYQGGVQPGLTINAKNGSNVSLSGSRIDNLTAVVDRSSIDGQSSTIGSVTAAMSMSSSLRFGTIDSLSITAPTTCAAEQWNEVYAVGVNDAFVTLNTIKITKTQYQDTCMRILFAGDERFDVDYEQ